MLNTGKNPGESICKWASKVDIGCLVTDFSALRPHRNIVQQVVEGSDNLLVYQVKYMKYRTEDIL